MNIELREVSIREIVDGYQNNNEEGVIGYGGKLNIRPKYQREFVYDTIKRNMVMDTVRKGYPLNIMYWVRTGEDTYELLDGQQRTISFCSYVNNDYSIDYKYFHNLEDDEKKQILDYKLMIYVCEGTDSEKLSWFKIVNIAGMPLSNQELRNAVYTGPWLSDAKRHFSKTGCAAYNLASDYVSGIPIKQDYLETALKWIADRDKMKIEEYMAQKQNAPNANELWLYFQSVISWVRVVFPNTRTNMRGLDWGIYYNKYHEKAYDANVLEAEINRLILDNEVTKDSGIYLYLLSGDEKHLSLRKFPDSIKLAVYTKQEGICVGCGEKFDFKKMHADHIIPWSRGGKTVEENCALRCAPCNFTKSDN